MDKEKSKRFTIGKILSVKIFDIQTGEEIISTDIINDKDILKDKDYEIEE